MSEQSVMQFDNVSPERWGRIKDAGSKFGAHLSLNIGTATAHGVVIAYMYQPNTLTITIMHIPTFFGHALISEEDASTKLSAWIAGIE